MCWFYFSTYSSSTATSFNPRRPGRLLFLIWPAYHVSLNFNLFLSFVDRYVCVAHSAWYKRKVTITWIVSGQIGSLSILLVLMKGSYFVELIPLPATVNITEMKIVSIVGFTTLLLRVFGQICVYFKLKYYLRLEKDADMALSTLRRVQFNSYTARQRQVNNMEGHTARKFH